MENILLGINVVFPLIVYMMVGGILNKIGWFSGQTLTEMNKLVFRVFMFLMLFFNTYTMDYAELFCKEFETMILIALISLFVIFCAAYLITGIKKLPPKRRAVITQGIYRSNLALFGLPICITIYGEGNTGASAILVAILVPIYNIIAAVLLGNVSGKKKNAGQIAKMIMQNPLVCGTILGLTCNFLHLSFPEFVLSPLLSLSKIATPLAFVILGATMEFNDIKKEKKTISLVCVLRLIVIPMVVIGTGICMGLRNEVIVALLGAFASPVAIASFSMAKDMDVEPQLAGEIVAVSTVTSLVTIFLWITILNQMHMV